MKLSKKEKAFITELKELMDKNNVSLISYDDYDHNDEYCGTAYFFVSRTDRPSININMREIQELLP